MKTATQQHARVQRCLRMLRPRRSTATKYMSLGDVRTAGGPNYEKVTRNLALPVPIQRSNAAGRARAPTLSKQRNLHLVRRDVLCKSSEAESVQLEDSSPSYVAFSFGDNLDLYISVLADGRYNMREVFLIGDADREQITPTITGEIESDPAHFQVIPVEALISGDMMRDKVQEKQLQHLVLVKEDPETEELDFRSTYAFHCARQEFYRVSPIDLHNGADLEEPILRFQPQHDRFLLDCQQTVPSPIAISDKHEGLDLGVDLDIDRHAEEVLAAHGSGDEEGSEGEAEALEADAIGVTQEEDTEDMLEDGPDLETYDTPDVPAVDMAQCLVLWLHFCIGCTSAVYTMVYLRCWQQWALPCPGPDQRRSHAHDQLGVCRMRLVPCITHEMRFCNRLPVISQLLPLCNSKANNGVAFDACCLLLHD
eukprot:TRINITY_DN6692_c0_g1_i2.p1 TRINITY_DN6692_c0_g1~~TRINITY_DN6692_c0_g1_i2.p1  ORF type:complete len:492 (+),score=51.05 TRINITY_DN6692_c0_g1_i2:206-1477(+)